MLKSFEHRVVLFGVFLLTTLLIYVYRKSFSRFYYELNNVKQTNSTDLYASKSKLIKMSNYSLEDILSFAFPGESPIVRAYLNVVRDTVCGLTLRTQEKSVDATINNTRPFDMTMRLRGLDWPLIGITMVGQRRLINIEWALRRVISMDVPGDFIECGVWRGGSSIFARAVLKALNDQKRHVWLADSFQGLPKARTSNDDDSWSRMEYLRVSLEEVQTNFQAFDLLDDRVHFCKGYFVDSLPRCNVSQIAVLRMDGDMYESTMDQLFNLYSKVQLDGVIIVDDYAIEVCQKAVHDFRNWHGITEQIIRIPGDDPAHYWIKKKMVKVQMDLYKPLLLSTTKDPPNNLYNHLNNVETKNVDGIMSTTKKPRNKLESKK